MAAQQRSQTIERWPEESREAAKLVIDKYGEPDEITETELKWFNRGKWKRIITSKAFYKHNFPAPHTDSIENVINYRVPVDKFSALAEFDDSVIVERTVGEVSARCHAEGANFLALSLMHDIVIGNKTAEQARHYCAKEFTDARRKRSTPYMEGLRFSPGEGTAADPDAQILLDDDLQEAIREGKGRHPQ